MTQSGESDTQAPDTVPAYIMRWRRCKRLGLVREDRILRDNEITGRGFGALIATFLVGLILLIATITTAIGLTQCRQFGEQYGRPTHWTPFSGCFVRLPDGRSITTGQITAFLPTTGRKR